MNLEEFNYELPESLIAAFPSGERAGSRLLVIRRATGEIIHSRFAELGNFLNAGDLLVLNDTKVFPARLLGTKDSGGKVEVLLIERFPDQGRSLWIAMADAAKKPQVGSMLRFGAAIYLADVSGGEIRANRAVQGMNGLMLVRSDRLVSPGLPGVYPCGEGAGYAGGIVSSAVDGLRVAEAIGRELGAVA